MSYSRLLHLPPPLTKRGSFSTTRIPTYLPQNYQSPQFATILLISETFSFWTYKLLSRNKISSPTALFSFIYILARLFNGGGGACKLPYPFIASVPIQKRQPRYHNEAAPYGTKKELMLYDNSIRIYRV